jgi:hypothetical protein
MYIRKFLNQFSSKLVLQLLSIALVGNLSLGTLSCKNDSLEQGNKQEQSGSKIPKSTSPKSGSPTTKPETAKTHEDPTEEPPTHHAASPHAKEEPASEFPEREDSIVASPQAASLPLSPTAASQDRFAQSPKAESPHNSESSQQESCPEGPQAASLPLSPTAASQDRFAQSPKAKSPRTNKSSQEGSCSEGLHAASPHAPTTSSHEDFPNQPDRCPHAEETSSAPNLQAAAPQSPSATSQADDEAEEDNQSPKPTSTPPEIPSKAEDEEQPESPETFPTQEEDRATGSAVNVDGILSLQVAAGKKANDITISGHNIAADKLPKESLNQYTLSCQIADTDATNPTEIVIQRKNTKADMNTAALGNILIKSDVKSLTHRNSATSVWELSPSDATHITILFFVHKGDKNTQIGTLNWCKEDQKKTSTQTKKEANEHQQGSSSNTDIVLGSMKGKVAIEPSYRTPKIFDITFTSTAAQPIPKAELAKIKFSYTITGEGDTSNMRLIRAGGSNEVGNDKTLKDILNATLTVNTSSKAQFILQPGKATKVTIQFFLEKDGQKISIGEYVWKK